MPNIALVLAYDGTQYHGFQRQRALPTIQEEVERALERLTGERLRVKGAGRTDAGVHARGQVVNFHIQKALPLRAYVLGLNCYLPDDIVVREAAEVPMDFDARRKAEKRHYRYTIYQGETPSPRWRRYAGWIRGPLDVEAMDRALQALVGTHDFAPFSGALGRAEASTRRTIFEAGIQRRSCLVLVDIVGNAFLPHQVRGIVGMLLRVGRGELSVEAFVRLIEGGGLPSVTLKARKAGPVAPPQGLSLERVIYPSAYAFCGVRG